MVGAARRSPHRRPAGRLGRGDLVPGSVSERALQAGLAELVAGRTTIVIAHRLSAVRRVDRILVFEDGRIVEEGTHDQLIVRPDGAYRRLYDTQAGAFGGTPVSEP